MRSLKWVMVAALVGLVGCGSEFDEDMLDYNDADALAEASEGKGDAVATTSTYYSIRRDFRKCIAPLCGGYFLKRVNRATTKCANGKYSEECYVASADFTAAGGEPSDAAQIVVRGKIVKKVYTGFGNKGEAILTEAWVAPNGNAPAGKFIRLTDNGIRCITTPCASLHEARLNSTWSKNVNGVDLSTAGATTEQTEAASNELFASGILATGANVSGVFQASQFFTRWAVAPPPPPPPPPPPSTCIKTGCSGQICADHDVITTCEFRPEYACYATATCETQADGSCGWTATEALTQCLTPIVVEDVDYGLLATPGFTLGGINQDLGRGSAAIFQFDGNQIFGVIGFTVDPPGGVVATQDLIMDGGSMCLGCTSRWQWTLRVPVTAAVGTTYTLTSQTPFSTKDDPNWAFSFTITVK